MLQRQGLFSFGSVRFAEIKTTLVLYYYHYYYYYSHFNKWLMDTNRENSFVHLQCSGEPVHKSVYTLSMLTSVNLIKHKLNQSSCTVLLPNPLRDPRRPPDPTLGTTVLNGLSNCSIPEYHMATGITESTCSEAPSRDTL